MLDDDKITLDRAAFKVLASDTRVSILKLLLKRRMTLSELSKKLGMSVSTIKEHLDSLVSADLIRQMDDGHKWKYYELTRDGRDIVQPSERRIFVLLGISIIAAIFGMNGLVGRLSSAPSNMLSASRDMLLAPMAAGEGMLESAAQAAPEAISYAPSFPYLELAVTVIALVVLGISIGWLYSRRK